MLRQPIRDCSDCELLGGGSCIFTKRTLEPDRLLVSQGSVPEEVSFVRRGVVALSAVSFSGVQTWGAVRGPRSLLGVEAISQTASACEVRALTEVDVCVASVPAVKEWLGSIGGARTLFERTLTELLEQRRDVDFQTGTVAARVARFALACERYIGGGHGQRPLSKGRVAALVGMRPETLSRVLRRFSDRGYLDSSGGVRVLDREALAALAQG